MKRLLGLLLVMGIVGCGPTEEESVAALEKLGALIKRNDNGEVVRVWVLQSTQITDAELEHLKGLTNLGELWLNNSRITDTGLVHLVGLTKLEWLRLATTRLPTRASPT